jgi:hypothetical protein
LKSQPHDPRPLARQSIIASVIEHDFRAAIEGCERIQLTSIVPKSAVRFANMAIVKPAADAAPMIAAPFPMNTSSHAISASSRARVAALRMWQVLRR